MNDTYAISDITNRTISSLWYEYKGNANIFERVLSFYCELYLWHGPGNAGLFIFKMCHIRYSS